MSQPSHSMDSMMNYCLTNHKVEMLDETLVMKLDDALSAEKYSVEIARMRTEQSNDDPFYIMDVGQVVRQHRQWTAGLPRVAPFYAVKCNNDPVLLRLLTKLGCGFDCASKPEIEQILSLGVSPDRIIYANPCKTASFIRFAAEKGVARMTFDSDSELHKIKRLFPSAKLVLRIAVSDPTAICQLNLKFGAEPVNQAASLLVIAAELGLDVVGISFHVGSGCRDPTAYGEAIAHARRLFDLGYKLGHPMTVLDLGGGYPGFPTVDISFEEIARVINDSLRIHFPASGGESVEIIAEPGRFYASAAYTLCTNVISVKECAGKDICTDADVNEEAYMYYLNDGVYGSFNCVLYDHAVPYGYAVNKGLNSSEWTRCSIWGPTCDSMDCVMANTRFPRLDAGDWIVFPNMGAYTIAAYSDFNGFEKPDVIYAVGESEWKMIELLLAQRQKYNLPAAQILLNTVAAEPGAPAMTDVWLANLYEKLNRMHVGAQPSPCLTESPSTASLSDDILTLGSGSEVDTESLYSAGGITLGTNDDDSDYRGMIRGFKHFDPS